MSVKSDILGPSPVWHPFTQHGLLGDVPVIARAQRAWLETADGSRILDAISSWWVTTHGHGEPRITAAIRDAAKNLDQVIFAGLTHEHAEAVARGLVRLAPDGLAHVFFSDSGSTAVEVALKMALGYWRNIGERRTRILAMEHAYHGDTAAAMSAGARGVFNTPYEPLLFDAGRIPFPRRGEQQLTLDALDTACAQGDAAALIVEPLILGAGGMLIYDAATLSEMARICRHHRVLFIADEVMTGWGRTGTLFACEQAGVSPDIMCVAKGLTGGALPLAATLATEAIFDAHVSLDRTRTFFHSSSYTANPICCAAARANIAIWEAEPVLDRIRNVAELQRQGLARLANDNRFTGIRQLGTIAAVDVNVCDAGYLAGIGPRLQADFMQRGVLLRPLGNTIYVMPPYCITPGEIETIYSVIDAVVGTVDT
jgi:adenosylmethionine---8-amino-7-oxononanoate aminotransferase